MGMRKRCLPSLGLLSFSQNWQAIPISLQRRCIRILLEEYISSSKCVNLDEFIYIELILPNARSGPSKGKRPQRRVTLGPGNRVSSFPI